MTDRLSRSITSPSVQFYLEADEHSFNAAANTHVVRCYLRAVNRGNTSTNYQWGNATVTGRVNGNEFHVTGSQANLSSGTSNGSQFWRRGPFDITVTGNPNGTATADVSLSVNYPNASGGGTTNTTFPLTTLVVAPGTPTGLSFVRNSDSQANLSWTNNAASHGQPTSNQIRTSVNGAGFSQVASISTATSLVLAVGANQRVIAQVRATNSAGSSAWSASSNAIFTTPAAPSGVAAVKDPSLDIVVSWTPHVAFVEHQHVVEHGTVAGGVTTWDGSPVGVVSAGVMSFTHSAPDPAEVHVYRVFARNTAVGALESAKVLSNEVQLLAPPNAPTFGTVPAYADRQADLAVPWAHNPVDSTAQTAYEFSYSTNGGSSWSTSGKVTSVTPSRTIAASTYAADTELTMRVRTWGQATTGGADGTGASPWSTNRVVTFKTRPTVTVVSPADSSTVTESALTVVLGFAQAEGASFVQATLGLYDGATLLEEQTSTTLAGTAFTTPVADGGTYTVLARVRDSNGIESAEAAVTFDVAYTLPVQASVSVVYLPESGVAQLEVTIPPADVGEEAAVAVTIRRTIDDTETLFSRFPVEPGTYTFLDTTPTLRGDNRYTFTTFSADGASVDLVEVLTTAEEMWAFLSTGPGFQTVVNFFGDHKVQATPSRSSSLVRAAGRELPIALFGEHTGLEVSGSATILPDEGSTPAEIETFLRTAGVVCYRDSTGRRIFGVVTGALDSPSSLSSSFTFKVVEADG